MATTIRLHAHVARRFAVFARQRQSGADGRDPDRHSGADAGDLDATVRPRLRRLRQALGLTLDQLAERSHLSPSTISRIETGKRAISLDVLVPLARALQIDLDSLLQGDATDTDVVIRPVADHRAGVTSWPLSRPTGSTVSVKMRIEPAVRRPEPRVHPGHDWFYVLDGRIRLTLGERDDRRGDRARPPSSRA